MSEDQAAQIENSAEEEPVVQDAEKSETETAAVENSEEGQRPEADENQNRGRAQKRINQLTRERYEEQQKREALEARLAELEKAQSEKAIVAPKEDDFDDYSEYQVKQQEYLTEATARKVLEKQQEVEKTKIAEAQQRDAQARTEKFLTKVESEKAQYEDFDDKFSDPVFAQISYKMDPELISIIQDSDRSVALTYHLASNIEEADQIARMSPIAAARQLALIEAGLKTPTPKTVSSAPDPVAPIGSKDTVEDDQSKMSTEKWMEWRNKNAKRY